MKETSKKILIVEDERPLREALRDILTRSGFLVLEAADGEKGLALALAEHPDITLLDLVMPKMNGTEMLTRLRADDWGKDAAVIVLTNLSADSGELVRNVVSGAPLFFLVKSDWDIHDVVDKVREVLTR